MINKKNLWFLTLFSLVLVLSVYYITMPTELLVTNNTETIDNVELEIEKTSVVEALKTEDNTNTLEEINKLKETIANKESTTEDKSKAFDTIKTLNQISSKEELPEICEYAYNYGVNLDVVDLRWGIKTVHNLDSFIKIDGDQIRVVIDSDDHSNTIANNIMKTIQNNFDTKQYISIQFK